MALRGAQTLAIKTVDQIGDLGVAPRQFPVHSDEPSAFQRTQVAARLVLAREAQKQVAKALRYQRVERKRKTNDHGGPRITRAGSGANPLDRLLNAFGTPRDFRCAGLGAGHRQHQRRAIPKVFEELDRPRALRQVVDAVEP
jgi:hypothetical protein